MVEARRQSKKVAILVETSKQFGRQILRGIARYQNYAEPWSIFTQERGFADPEPAWIDEWDGDGIITRHDTKEHSLRAAANGVAVVNLRYVGGDDSLPSLYSSESQISELASEHFMTRGFEQFAYCGVTEAWSEKRGETFASLIRDRGFPCHWSPLGDPENDDWERDRETLIEWVESLPKPIAILAANDPRGLQVLDACRQLEVDVPGEVSVLGVDNDPELCALARPPLSSIDQGVQEIGYRAAELLDRLMEGGQPEQLVTHCRGAFLVTRESTDTLAIDDPQLRKALLFIADNSSTPIAVGDVVAATGISRRALEIRFKDRLKCTIRQQIQVHKLRLLKRLLAETTMTLAAIAERAGYSYTEHMVTMFRREVGETPGQYRKRRRQ